MGAEQPGSRAWRARGSRDRALLLVAFLRGGQMPKTAILTRQPAAGLWGGEGDGCLCLGVARGPHMWEGPQGGGAQGHVLGFSSCLGTGLAGGWGGGGGRGGRGGSPQPLSEERRASGLGLSPIPRGAGSSVRVRPGDPETKRLEERGVLVWGREQGCRGPVTSSNRKPRSQRSGRAREEGRGPLLSARGRQGPSCLPRTKGKPRTGASLPREGGAPPRVVS